MMVRALAPIISSCLASAVATQYNGGNSCVTSPEPVAGVNSRAAVGTETKSNEGESINLMQKHINIMQKHATQRKSAVSPAVGKGPFCNVQQIATAWRRIPGMNAKCSPDDYHSVQTVGRVGNAAVIAYLSMPEKSYNDTSIASPDGCYLQSAYWCKQGGVLGYPEENKKVYDNFTAIQEMGRRVRSKYESTAKSTSVLDLATAELRLIQALGAARKLPTAQERTDYLESHHAPELADKKWANYVRQGVETCMVEACLWNYCRIHDDSNAYMVGMGCQCHDDWAPDYE